MILFFISIISLFTYAESLDGIWEKARQLSTIQKEEIAINGVWIQGIRYIQLKAGPGSESVKLPHDYPSFHQLSESDKATYKKRFPALVPLIHLIDPERYQRQQTQRDELRKNLQKSIQTSKVDLKVLLLSVHRSKDEIDSSVVDELLGLEYEKTETSIQGDYPNEAWMNQPKELSQTDYELLRKIFKAQPPAKGSIAYDLGSGYGRFGLYGGLLFPEVKFKGIELVKERVEVAQALARRLKLKNVTFYHEDVLKADFSDGSYFYIFNSFPSIETQVLLKLSKLAKKKKITIVCLGNIYKTLLQTPWLKQSQLLDHWQQLAIFESF